MPYKVDIFLSDEGRMLKKSHPVFIFHRIAVKTNDL